ncbi:unnamed protein product [Toxocara canis]|uniref:Secreted protein n=1 Tax=Toxocara canis TaxID=6265 RepID=A0A183V227_TOXCA|nr:unnamed protein product [Toxocara canis]
MVISKSGFLMLSDLGGVKQMRLLIAITVTLARFKSAVVGFNQAKKAHQKTEKTLKKSNESSTPAASAASVNASTKRKKRVEKPKRQHANDYDNLDPDEIPQDKDEGNNEGKHAQNNKKNAANAKTPQVGDALIKENN